MHISSKKSGTEVVEELTMRRFAEKIQFCYHWISIDKVLLCSIALKMSQHNHSNIMILFNNHCHMYSLVHTFFIKGGTEVVEYFS